MSAIDISPMNESCSSFLFTLSLASKPNKLLIVLESAGDSYFLSGATAPYAFLANTSKSIVIKFGSTLTAVGMDIPSSISSLLII